MTSSLNTYWPPRDLAKDSVDLASSVDIEKALRAQGPRPRRSAVRLGTMAIAQPTIGDELAAAGLLAPAADIEQALRSITR